MTFTSAYYQQFLGALPSYFRLETLRQTSSAPCAGTLQSSSLSHLKLCHRQIRLPPGWSLAIRFCFSIFSKKNGRGSAYPLRIDNILEGIAKRIFSNSFYIRVWCFVVEFCEHREVLVLKYGRAERICGPIKWPPSWFRARSILWCKVIAFNVNIPIVLLPTLCFMHSLASP